MELPSLATEAIAWMYQGQWVAECPRPGCFNVEKSGRCDDGTTGGLDRKRFYCRIEYGGCGMACAAAWPYRFSEIEALVRARPVPASRNWRPGEDLLDLLGENLQHGIVPTSALEGGPSRSLLAIIDDEVQVGALESAPRLQVEGG